MERHNTTTPVLLSFNNLYRPQRESLEYLIDSLISGLYHVSYGFVVIDRDTHSASPLDYSQLLTLAGHQLGATAATSTLLKVMLDQSTPGPVGGAECVINHSSKAIEIEVLEFRVAELERAPGSAEKNHENRCSYTA